MKNIRSLILSVFCLISIQLSSQVNQVSLNNNEIFIVPPNITSISVEVRGASGGDFLNNNNPGNSIISSGGKGGYIRATIFVEPGDQIKGFLGEQGRPGHRDFILTPPTPFARYASGGGGGSAIVLND